MGRTSGARAKVASTAETVAGYVDPLIKDEKVRQRLLDALAIGVAARQRARRQMGISSLARRLGSDPVLRDQIAELATHLRDIRSEVGAGRPAKRAKSHRVRNTTLLIAGAGLIVASRPSLRDKIMGKVKGLFSGESHDDDPFSPPASPSAASVNTDATVGPDAPA